ncbi:MAG: hypothetical protein HPY60_00385 [Candidatus Methanofastidiosum sp.]|nr:hypothetical protein [Methanofastidiosum sp.]
MSLTKLVEDQREEVKLAIKNWEEGSKLVAEGKFPEAIELMENALKVLTESGYRDDATGLINQLGIAYMLFPIKDNSTSTLLKSIEYLDEAVSRNPVEDYPEYNAMSYYNLGNAYLNLSQFVDREKNLNRAIGCFKRALGVWASDAFHLEP